MSEKEQSGSPPSEERFTETWKVGVSRVENGVKNTPLKEARVCRVQGKRELGALQDREKAGEAELRAGGAGRCSVTQDSGG